MARANVPEVVESRLLAREDAAELTVADGRREWVAILAWRVAIAVLGLAAWQAASGRLVDLFWISSPYDVAVHLLRWIRAGTLWLHVQITLVETLLGFLLGGVSGVAVGLILGLNRRVANVVDPFIVAVYSLPKVALAPLFILWFGVDLASKVVLATVVVFFLVFYNTYAGTLDVDGELIDVMRLMGASKRQVVRMVVLPSALIWIFTGMKISVPYALIGAVVGEIMASNRGLGYLIQASAGQFDTGGVFAALFVLMLIALTLHTVLKRSESFFLRWKGDRP